MTYVIPYRLFVLWFIGFFLTLPILLSVINAALELEPFPAASGLFAMMFSSMVVGRRYALTVAVPPTGRAAWGIAARLTSVGMAITAVLQTVLFMLDPTSPSVGALMILALLVVFFWVMYWICGKIWLGIGARGALKSKSQPGPVGK